MSKHLNARRAGGAVPGNDEGPTVAPVAPLHDQDSDGAILPGGRPSGQALRVIEGEAQAAQFLARLRAQQADPDELALIVATLYGATLRGFCRVLCKAIGGAT